MKRVAFILKGYPRLSESFIAQEILALEQRGLRIQIVSLRHPTDPKVHPVHEQISAPVLYLPEYLHREPLRVLRGLGRALLRPAFPALLVTFLNDWIRDRTRNRARRFGQSLVLAAELESDVCHLHAHFLHTPASVARYTGRLRRQNWTASAHATDIWTNLEWDLREKLAECQWLVTCTAVNREHLRGLALDPERVELVYHGLDLERFVEPPAVEGMVACSPVTILSVGRAVEKKGYDVLLDALARLDNALGNAPHEWRFVHIGGGQELERLKRKAEKLGISSRIEWRGPMSQGDVLRAYRDSDLFVLASQIAGNGDRDGLPNVLMEAQSQAVACVASCVSAIPELIDNGVTGLLVEPGDAAELVHAIRQLIVDPDLRARIGAAGRDRVRTRFNMHEGIDQLETRFRATAPTAFQHAAPVQSPLQATTAPRTHSTAANGHPSHSATP